MKMDNHKLDALLPAKDPEVDLRESKGRANFISLSLPDLPLDNTGSIVIQTDGDVLVVELSGYQELIHRGIAPEGHQSEHFNVAGMDYCRFASGATLYFAADEVRLLLVPE